MIFISEHWLSNAEKPIIKEILNKNQKLHFTPAEKKATGRPYGGICFIINKERIGETTVVHEDEHILAIRCSINNKSYIFLCLYLTCYHGNSTVNDYQQELNILTGLLQLYGDECQIIMIGDLQTFPTEIYDHLPVVYILVLAMSRLWHLYLRVLKEQKKQKNLCPPEQ